MAQVNVEIKGRIFPYELFGPHIFKDGENKGLTVESMMFSNRKHLVKLKNIRDHNAKRVSNPDKLHLHLAWILNAGEFVKAPLVCPHCSNEWNNIKFFSISRRRGAFIYGRRYVSCGEPACVYESLEEDFVPHPLKFSTLEYFSKEKELAKIGDFFREVFLESDKLDPGKAFELFLNASTTVQH